MPNIDALLKIRTHGAVNIRGIRFQILYSVSRAFALIGEGAAISQVTLEGIEDVDLKGMRTDDQYIQVKTADAPWKWNQLKDPLKGFLQVARADQTSIFTLAVSFLLEGDISRLARYLELPAPEQREMYRKFVKLCGEIGATEAESSRSHPASFHQPESLNEICWHESPPRLCVIMTSQAMRPVSTYVCSSLSS